MSEDKTPVKMPIWVLLAFSSIQKRKHAIILIWVCAIFTIYCLPWVSFIDNDMVSTVFLIDDWSWFAMMLPMCFWYIFSLRWMDNNAGWETI